MISAGDHERLPKSDKDDKGEKIDLTDKDRKELKLEKDKLPKGALYRLRKGIKPGKFAMLGEIDKELKVLKPKSPVKSPNSGGNMSTLLDMAKNGSFGIKSGRLPKRPPRRR